MSDFNHPVKKPSRSPRCQLHLTLHFFSNHYWKVNSHLVSVLIFTAHISYIYLWLTNFPIEATGWRFLFSVSLMNGDWRHPTITIPKFCSSSPVTHINWFVSTLFWPEEFLRIFPIVKACPYWDSYIDLIFLFFKFFPLYYTGSQYFFIKKYWSVVLLFWFFINIWFWNFGWDFKTWSNCLYYC